METLPPGTPSKRNKGRRFEMRITEADDALITEAAALAGISRSDLGAAALRAYAKDVIADYRATLISTGEFAALQTALDTPPAPNERIRRAVERMREERAARQ